jgi:iron complex transport system substrate-binding protein
MNWKNKLINLIISACLLVACQTHPSKAIDADKDTQLLPLEYAKGFQIEENESEKILKIYTLNDDKKQAEVFHLIGAQNQCSPKDANVIPVPCKRIICLSSTQLTYFFALDDIDDIVAINSSRHLFHEEMNQRIEKHLVKQIGKEGHFNTELIASLNPDVIFVSPFKTGGFDALKSLGFPLVPMAAYEEETPLGRAEWIKMIAAFIDKQTEADSLFNAVVSRYDSLKQLTANVEYRPTVFSGKMRSGTWYVPGGDSFYAHYFRDAGARYIFKDNKKGAHPLDFETVYATAANCDFWRILLPEPPEYNKQSMKREDPRYADFKAFDNNRIFVCNIREVPYYEQNAMKPDVILADYIHFFHPELLPNYQPCFYKQLK